MLGRSIKSITLKVLTYCLGCGEFTSVHHRCPTCNAKPYVRITNA